MALYTFTMFTNNAKVRSRRSRGFHEPRALHKREKKGEVHALPTPTHAMVPSVVFRNFIPIVISSDWTRHLRHFLRTSRHQTVKVCLGQLRKHCKKILTIKEQLTARIPSLELKLGFP